jgi:hypothetical protein
MDTRFVSYPSLLMYPHKQSFPGVLHIMYRCMPILKQRDFQSFPGTVLFNANHTKPLVCAAILAPPLVDTF